MIHKHHIIPVHAWTKCHSGCNAWQSKRGRKHTCGLDDPSNLIVLTTEEHAEAHKQLWLMDRHPLDEIAYLSLSGQIGNEKAFKMAQRARGGIPLTAEHKAKLSRSHIGKNYGPEHAEKCKINALNRTPESNAQRGIAVRKHLEVNGKPEGFGGKGKANPYYGKKHKQETKDKHSKLMMGRTWSLDPSTGKRVWGDK